MTGRVPTGSRMATDEVACIPGPKGEDVYVIALPQPLPAHLRLPRERWETVTYQHDGTYWLRIGDDTLIPVYRPVAALPTGEPT